MTTPNPWAIAADILDPRPDPYADDPVGWAKAKLDAFLWSKQIEVAESVRDHRYTAVHSAHDMGKSFAAATIAAWWIDSHPPGEAFVVSTAPTFPQVEAILWREIGRAHRKGNLVGRVNLTDWYIGPEKVGFGRKPADTDPAAFQGIHAKYVLVVIDEACGVPKTIFDAADALVTNEHSRMLAIGNPDDPTSHFATVCKPGSGWNVIHIDGLASPNFTDEPVPDELRPLLLSPTWVEERAQRWGETSPLYTAKVRGIFPEDTGHGVVRLSAMSRCREPREWAPDDLLPVSLGVDVGAGGDYTSIRERRGVKAGRVWRDHSDDWAAVVGKVILAIRETGATRVKIDVGGIGWGVVGRLKELAGDQHHAEIVPVNFGAAAWDRHTFPRLRDQLWWEIGRELSENGAVDLSEMEDADDTIAQLIAPQWKPDSAGRIKVEQKHETRKRLGRSPDDADAYLLAFFEPPPDIDEIVTDRDEYVISPV